MIHGKTLLEAKEELMKIKGIGNWTANYAIMRTFRYPDAFPLEDVALHKAITDPDEYAKEAIARSGQKDIQTIQRLEAYATSILAEEPVVSPTMASLPMLMMSPQCLPKLRRSVHKPRFQSAHVFVAQKEIFDLFQE